MACSRIGRVNVDTVNEGVVIGNLAPKVLVNNNPIVVVGALIAPHPPGHVDQIMIEGSDKVLAQNIPICRVGDLASCLHALDTGSENTVAGP